MKKLVLVICLLVIFFSGCEGNVGFLKQYCKDVSACVGLEPTIDCTGNWACEENYCTFICDGGEMPSVNLLAKPTVGVAPLDVTFTTHLYNYEGYEEQLYCTGFSWDFGEGEKVVAMPGCVPYEEGIGVETRHENYYTYETPGTYEVVFSVLGLDDLTVTSAPLIIAVLPEDAGTCKEDSDCVPAECCHPTTVVNKQYVPHCAAVACTMSCEGPLDCGAGHSECQEGQCIIVPDGVI